MNTQIPTTLLIGNENSLFDATLKILQQKLCKNKPNINIDCYCSECRKLKNHQHPSVVWIEPEKKYVIEDIKIIFEKISFQLADDEVFFFILSNTQNLTPATSNKLLKTLEEPPTGYRFILTANNEQSILPTIRSRCRIEHLTISQQAQLSHPLLQFLLDKNKRTDVLAFEQTLRNEKPTEELTINLLHELISHTQKQIIQSHQDDKSYQNLETQLQYLLQLLRTPPQAGSASIFWKQLFLSFPGDK